MYNPQSGIIVIYTQINRIFFTAVQQHILEYIAL